MSEKDENSMIGYDPLAWMHEAEKVDEKSNSKETIAAQTDTSAIINCEEPGEKRVSETELTESDPQTLGIDMTPVESDKQTDIDDELTSEVAVMDMEESDTVENADATSTECQIALAPLQNIQTVGQLHQQLQRMLIDNNRIDIDASAVTQIDTATLQLLLVLKLTAVKLQKDLNIDFPSEKFMEASNLLGLSEMLCVDQAAAGFF